VSPKRRSLGSAVVAFVFALLILLPGTGVGFWGRDEAGYAGVAHTMNATANYLVPRIGGRLYADKPPLAEWLTAVSFRLLGEGEFAGRLPHVLLAAGSVGLLFLLGARLFDWRRGLCAAILFSVSLMFVVYGRLLLTDSALLFFTVASLLGLVPILEDQGTAWGTVMTGVALGFAILAKGPVALLAPSLFCIGYLAGSREHRSWLSARLLIVLIPALALASPWFLLAAHATAGESLRSFLLRENLGRFLKPMQGHRGSLVFYPAVLWFGFFPASGLLPLLFRGETLRRLPVRWGLLFWAAGSFAFFSLSATKLPHYLLPCIPAIALLVADLAWPRSATQLRVAAWTSGVTSVSLFLGVVVAARYTAEPAAFGLLVPFGLAALFCLTGVLLASLRNGPGFTFCGWVFASVALASGVVPALDPLRSTHRLGLVARSLRRPGEPVGGLQILEPAFTYYAGQPPAEYWRTAAEVARAVALSPTGSGLVWLDSRKTVSLVRDGRMRVEILSEGLSLADPRIEEYLQLCRVRPLRGSRDRSQSSRRSVGPGHPRGGAAEN
jgi:4-amino-4-deoxy-L-arabinose transferase-like glycosyltransferase